MDKLSEMRVGFFSGLPILGAVIIGTGGFLLYSTLTKLRKDHGLPLNLENGLFLDPAKENAIKVFSAAGWITLLLSSITALYIVFTAPVELVGNKINSLIILILSQTVLLFSFYMGKNTLTRGAYQQPIDKNH
jgi:hypothetical protein